MTPLELFNSLKGKTNRKKIIEILKNYKKEYEDNGIIRNYK